MPSCQAGCHEPLWIQHIANNSGYPWDNESCWQEVPSPNPTRLRALFFPTSCAARLAQGIWLLVLSQHRVNFMFHSMVNKSFTLSLISSNPAGENRRSSFKWLCFTPFTPHPHPQSWLVQSRHLTHRQLISGLFNDSFYNLAHTHKSWENPHFFLGNLDREMSGKIRFGRMFRSKK